MAAGPSIATHCYVHWQLAFYNTVVLYTCLALRLASGITEAGNDIAQDHHGPPAHECLCPKRAL